MGQKETEAAAPAATSRSNGTSGSEQTRRSEPVKGVVEYVLLRLEEIDNGGGPPYPAWVYVGRCSGRTKRDAWDEAEQSWSASMPGDGERTDFRLVPLSAWGDEFSVRGESTIVREVTGL
jgi:hypothetical protein